MVLTLATWLAAMVWHVALSARVVARWQGAEATLDERVFGVVLGSLASLLCVLHVVAMTVGLSLPSGFAGLAIWHAALWWGTARRRPSAQRVVPADRVTWQEALALAAVGAVLFAWIGTAAASPDLLGPDAPHYHIPYAVNFAVGAGLFAPPATPHLYPMAGSLMSAWFIVPLGDPLIADLALAWPFALAVASINLLFRCATGLSGTAWATWFALALFSTPLFRASSLGSADLWFAAGFVSLVAVIGLGWFRRRWTATEVVLGGCAMGVLLGSKTSGAPAAVLIVAGAVALSWFTRFAGGVRLAWPRPWWTSVAVALGAAIGAGGIWLIRNWVLFGSPVAPAGLTIAGVAIFPGAPFQPTTYFSVLGELESASYQLWPRAEFYIDRWLGPWFFVMLWPIGLLAIDLAVRARRRRADDRWWPRLNMLLLTLGVGTALIWLLIGAPWTALERSGGLTLRYALPVAALLPLLGFIGCFPLAGAWYARTRVRSMVAVALMLGTWVLVRISVGAEALAPGLLPTQGVPLVWLGVGLIGGGIWWRVGPRLHWFGRRTVAVLAVLAVVAWAPFVARRDRDVRAAARATLDAEETAFAAGSKPARWREAFLAVRAAERDLGHRCQTQRFFSLTRFDEPLALQGPDFTNQVYYAGRDEVGARRAGPLGACDYVITTPAVADTDKGQAMAAALAGGAPLRLFVSTGSYLILSVKSN